jgi:hypothetical protein
MIALDIHRYLWAAARITCTLFVIATAIGAAILA